MASSVHDGDDDEDKEESASSRSKKRAAPEDVEEVQPSPTSKIRCRPKLVLSDSSDSNKVSERRPSVKPHATRYIS